MLTGVIFGIFCVKPEPYLFNVVTHCLGLVKRPFCVCPDDILQCLLSCPSSSCCLLMTCFLCLPSFDSEAPLLLNCHRELHLLDVNTAFSLDLQQLSTVKERKAKLFRMTLKLYWYHSSPPPACFLVFPLVTVTELLLGLCCLQSVLQNFAQFLGVSAETMFVFRFL